MIPYYTRIFQAYLGGGVSHLSFWHEQPEVNEQAFRTDSQQYYMTFAGKARYAGPFDNQGVPLLDYRGKIGRQYNPIAVAQYGLAAWNAAKRLEVRDQRSAASSNLQSPSTPISSLSRRFLACSDWLVNNLEPNAKGVPVWMHKFDWEYFRTLKAPWYSGLAQGQGVALLVRAFQATGQGKYCAAAEAAMRSLVTPIQDGGCLHIDGAGDWWIEEYITDPPTHILNGFVWALWGIADFVGMQIAKRKEPGADPPTVDRFRTLPATELWDRSLGTLERNLQRFDTGYGSLYDLAPTGMRNVASPFYHQLHIVQMDIMHRLTSRECFRVYRDRWAGYAARPWNRRRALAQKAIFKLLYY